MQNSFVLLLSLSRNLYHDLAIYIFAWEIFYCLGSLALNHDFMNRNGILGTAEPPFALVVHIESGNLKNVQKPSRLSCPPFFEQSCFKNFFWKLFSPTMWKKCSSNREQLWQIYWIILSLTLLKKDSKAYFLRKHWGQNLTYSNKRGLFDWCPIIAIFCCCFF